MTSPNGPDHDDPQGQPGYGASQQPPAGYNPQGYSPQGYNPQGYGPQGQDPAPGYDPAPAYSGGSAPTGQRPGMVTAAAVIGIVIGALGLLGVFGIGTLFSFDTVLGLIALLSVATAAVLLAGGIQALQGKSPRLLLLGSYASIGIQLLQLIWGALSGYGFLFFGLLGFILPGLIIFLLMRPESKQHYGSRGISY